MKKIIPSFQIQIIVLFLCLLLISLFFNRSFFISSFEDYLEKAQLENVEQNIKNIYNEYSSDISQENQEKFKNDVENIMTNVKQIDIAKESYKKEILSYSIYIVVFIFISLLIVFIFSFNLISKPLARLQKATNELKKGNLKVTIKESKFSPLNDLIISFNTMISELEVNQQKLVEAEKKLLWREIARVMAHEIKNPLTPIRLSAERLEMKYLEKSKNIDEIFQESMSIIKEEMNNLQTLVTRFRDFATMPQANPETYSLNEQLSDIILPYKSRTEIISNIPEDLPDIFADKLQMRQVFVNLIQNAIQSRDKNNQVIVSAKIEYFLLI